MNDCCCAGRAKGDTAAGVENGLEGDGGPGGGDAGWVRCWRAAEECGFCA